MSRANTPLRTEPLPMGLASYQLASMGTMQRIGSFDCVQASREVLLEIQVSQFINEFLFSGMEDCRGAFSSSPSRRTKGDKSMPPHLRLQSPDYDTYRHFGAGDNAESGAPCTVHFVAEVPGQNSAVSVDMSNLMGVGTERIPEAFQSTRLSSSVDGLEEVRLNVEEQERCLSDEGAKVERKASCCSSTTVESEANKAPMSNSQAMAMVQGTEGEGEGRNPQFNRTQTFPCENSRTQEGQKQMKNMENSNGWLQSWGTQGIKHSCKKPPRPPARTPSAPPSCPRLTKCVSDTNLLQSSRRARLERIRSKRKMAAAATAANATSMWALIITLCFAVVMVVQGFLSQGSPSLAVEVIEVAAPTVASSDVNAEAFPSIKMKISSSSVGGAHVLQGGGLGTSEHLEDSKTVGAIPVSKVFEHLKADAASSMMT